MKKYFEQVYIYCGSVWRDPIWRGSLVSSFGRDSSYLLGLLLLSPSLFNFYAEYIMWNARVDEAQAGIKTSGRNINTLRYANDTTLMVESKEKLRSLLMREEEESEKAGLKLNIQKTKIMDSSPITSWQIDGEKVQIVADFIFLGSKINVDGDWSHEIKRCSLEGKLWQT